VRVGGLALVLLVACGQEPATSAPEVTPPPAEPLTEELRSEPAAEPAVEPAEVEPVSDGAEIARAVAQLFEQRCHECHGTGRRPKGGLRLTDMSAVLARSAEEALIVAGKPEESALFQRLALPAEHEDVMPPEGGPLAAEELALVRRWIEAGAPWSAAEEVAQQRGAPEPAEPIAPLTPEQRGTRDAALARLVERGAHAARLSSESDAVAVDLGVAMPPATGADLALLTGLEPCLVELSLARAPLVASDLAALGRFGELRRLRLDHVPLGDAGLAHLATLAKLESLNLYGTQVTAAGLAPLAGPSSLRRLYLGGNGLAPETLVELGRALTGCALFGDGPP
jgi:mono/diheme cytochrome c family protein